MAGQQSYGHWVSVLWRICKLKELRMYMNTGPSTELLFRISEVCVVRRGEGEVGSLLGSVLKSYRKKDHRLKSIVV